MEFATGTIWSKGNLHLVVFYLSEYVLKIVKRALFKAIAA